jgi:hypothetical protein
MFKRTKGYLLLTMLVLTGLAGRIHSDTLTHKERRHLVTELKSSRTDFIKSLEGLSNKQLNFKPAKNKPSIKDCVFKIIATEKCLWTTAQASLNKKTEGLTNSFEDEALTSVLQQPKTFNCEELQFKSVKEAMKLYKNERTGLLRYVNTSTQNVRSHIVQTNLGNFDAYQLMLLNTIYCKYYTQQIDQIKSTPNFPK